MLITVEDRLVVANDVNADGIVVGDAYMLEGGSTTFPRAFIWTKDSGASFLETRVSNMPENVHLSNAHAIGDGGHVLAYAVAPGQSLGWVLLTPEP